MRQRIFFCIKYAVFSAYKFATPDRYLNICFYLFECCCFSSFRFLQTNELMSQLTFSFSELMSHVCKGQKVNGGNPEVLEQKKNWLPCQERLHYLAGAVILSYSARSYFRQKHIVFLSDSKSGFAFRRLFFFLFFSAFLHRIGSVCDHF